MMNSVQQSRFRAGRSCINNIFCLKQIIEKKRARNQKIHIAFINLQNAYDMVLLMKTVGNSNINYTLIKALKNLYEGSRSRIKQNNSLCERTFQYHQCIRDAPYLYSARFIYLRSYNYGNGNSMEWE